MSDQQLLVAPVEPAVKLDLVDGTIADELVDVSVIAAPAPLESEGRNLFGEAGSPPGLRRRTRRQCSSIFRAFGDWLCSELGRPPLVADLDTDAIAQPAVDRTLHRALQSLSQPATPCFRQPDPLLSLPHLSSLVAHRDAYAEAPEMRTSRRSGRPAHTELPLPASCDSVHHRVARGATPRRRRSFVRS